ncbi:MAG TPA: hypothetical protein VGB02_09450 [Pyrinomonadaceae bacterium]|jgi:hypothetical protein
MSGLSFIKNYDGRRVTSEFTWNALPDGEADDGNGSDDDTENRVLLDIEMEADDWRSINPQLPAAWRASDWAARPVRFVDGKDAGQTIAWVRNPQGFPVSMRLAEIGGVAMRAIEGELRREFAMQERVLTMDTSGFPWEEIENFAIALSEFNLRLLPTTPVPADLELSFDRVERVRRFAQNRSRQEMSVLEEFVIAQDNRVPTIVDGILKDHEGGFDAAESPVFGVVKTHRRTYLHALGHQVLFDLAEGERTPAFSFEYDTSQRTERGATSRLPIVAWFVRLCGKDVMPNFGLVRVEVSQLWFKNQGYLSAAGEITGTGRDFVNQLTRTIHEYRCRRSNYRRAAISIEPIVRAEDSLGALFCPPEILKSKFYRMTGL